MSIQAGTHNIGPANGSLKVMTGKEGAAAKMGHNLVLAVNSWEGTVEVGDSTSVQLTADPSSVEVESGTGGAKALSDKDKADIKKSIDKKVLGSSQIMFQSSDASVEGGALSVSGNLSIAGGSNSVSIPCTIGGDGTVRGSLTINQSDYGIKQFSTMMGALKAKDAVTIEVEAKLPTE